MIEVCGFYSTGANAVTAADLWRDWPGRSTMCVLAAAHERAAISTLWNYAYERTSKAGAD